MPTLLLNKKDVQNLINMNEVITVVEAAFKDCAEGKGVMPPKVYLTVKDGDSAAMPAACREAAGMKWVNVHQGTRRRGLPTVMAVLFIMTPLRVILWLVMDATEIDGISHGSYFRDCFQIPCTKGFSKYRGCGRRSPGLHAHHRSCNDIQFERNQGL